MIRYRRRIMDVPQPRALPQQLNSFSTDFLLTENPLSEGGNWLNGGVDGLDWTNFKSGGGWATAAAYSSTPPPPYNDAVAVLKTSAYAAPPDQWAEMTVRRTADGLSGTSESGLFLRATITAHSITGYEFYVNHSANFGIVVWKGPQNSFGVIGLGTPSSPVDGDVFRAEAQGNTLRFYQNGSLISTVADITAGQDVVLTSGQPGMQKYVDSPNVLEAYCAKSFRCGAL